MPIGRVRVDEPTERRHATGVEQGIQPTEHADGLVDEAPAVVFHPHVGTDPDEVATTFGDQIVEALGSSPDGHHARAGRRRA